MHLRSPLTMLCVALPLFASAPALATFDWGAKCGEEGFGSFQQFVPEYEVITVGEIPAGKQDVEIRLNSPQDVDIQLLDAATGTRIIHWPNGLLNGPGKDSVVWQGVEYVWSGYNGDGTGLGNEYIRIKGTTNRTLVMKAFGYKAGEAQVDYTWLEPDTCSEPVAKGSGSFEQPLSWQAVEVVGDIPAGLVNVDISLETDTWYQDIDIQLYDGATPIVQWPSGILSGPTTQKTTYEGMAIEWSGYNGTGGWLGNEHIKIRGELTRTLTMKVFAYSAGSATVNYAWGLGIDDACGADEPCLPGLTCKGIKKTSGVGVCKADALWCTPATVAADCAENLHPAVPGFWTCEPNADLDDVCTWRHQDAFAPVALETLLGDPKAWIGEGQQPLVQVTWEIGKGGLAACTKMYCPAENPCCNMCHAFMHFEGEAAWANGVDPTVRLTGIGCVGDECDWASSCDYADGEWVTVRGRLSEGAPGSLLIDVFGSEVAQSCSLANQSCPTHQVCMIGVNCPTPDNCGFNPPGMCVEQ